MNIKTITDLAVRTGGIFIILDIGSNGSTSRISVIGDIFPTEILNLVDEGAHAIEFDDIVKARQVFWLTATTFANDHTLLYGTVTLVQPGQKPVSFDIDEDDEYSIVDAQGAPYTMPVYNKIGLFGLLG